MGGITPMQLLQVAELGHSIYSTNRQTEAAIEAYHAQTEAQARQIRQAQEIEEKRTRDSLRRALAAQRARFGGSGLTGADGSAGAVLQGLTNQAESEMRANREQAEARLADLDLAYSVRRRRSLLDAANTRASQLFNLLRQGIGTFSLLER